MGSASWVSATEVGSASGVCAFGAEIEATLSDKEGGGCCGMSELGSKATGVGSERKGGGCTVLERRPGGWSVLERRGGGCSVLERRGGGCSVLERRGGGCSVLERGAGGCSVPERRGGGCREELEPDSGTSGATCSRLVGVFVGSVVVVGWCGIMGVCTGVGGCVCVRLEGMRSSSLPRPRGAGSSADSAASCASASFMVEGGSRDLGGRNVWGACIVSRGKDSCKHVK